MIIKRFRNGNFNIKYEPKYDYNNNLIEQLCNSLELDFTIAGDEGCICNWSMYYPLYNANTDMLYLITGEDCYKYTQGKAVKLYGHIMNDEERETLNNFIGGSKDEKIL